MSGSNGLLSAPDGWIVDGAPPRPQIAAFYPMGLARDEAFHTAGYIYLAHSKKDSKWPDLAHLLETQERGIRGHYRSARLAYGPVELRDDCACRVRHLETDELLDRIESTLFLDFPEVIIFLNLLAPKAKHPDYLKKLYWIAEKLIKVTVVYDPTKTPLAFWKDAR
jgi:hypothetical protein